MINKTLSISCNLLTDWVTNCLIFPVTLLLASHPTVQVTA